MATRLPRQVQAQLEAVDALYQQTPPANPPADPSADPPQPPAPNPEPPTVEPPQPQPPAPAPAVPQSDNWEHKYRVLQGMFNQQGNQLKELNRTMQEMQARLATQPPTPTPAPTPAPQPTADPKDVESFGLDMVQMVQRVTGDVLANAGRVFEQRLQVIEGAINKLQQAIQGTTQTVAATAEDLFFEKLTQFAPKWSELNSDQAFLAWLSEIDPIYGAPRDAALKDAQAKGDAKRAAAVFNAYIATLPPAPAPAPSANSPTPRSAAGGEPAAPPAKPTFTQAQVAAFYNDVRRGVYRANPQEQQRLEAMYNAAMAEGRIV